MILFKTPVFVNFIIQVFSYVLAKYRKIFIFFFFKKNDLNVYDFNK